MENMPQNQNPARIIIAIVAILVVGGVFVGIKKRDDQKLAKQTPGTITAIDLATGKATIEIVIPQTGEKQPYTSKIPSNCEITINGKPAKLEDVQVGDRVIIDRIGTKKIKAVHIERAGATATSPPTKPAQTSPDHPQSVEPTAPAKKS